MVAENYSAWRFWLDIFQLLITGAIGFYVWISNNQRVTSKRIGILESEIDHRLDGHESRLSAVEATCQLAPNHNDLNQVYERINAVSDGMNNLAGEMKAMRRSVDLIHQHLLAQKQGGD